jgi:hypothetical protein
MMPKILNKANLQFFAITAMALDHAAFLMPDHASYYLCRLLGRITIVIMSFFTAEGYYKTSNAYKYILRMGIFAVISQIPFNLYMSGHLLLPLELMTEMYLKRNVIFTLFTALCLLAILKSDEIKKPWKVIACIAALYVTRNSDWKYFCLMWVLAFGLLRERPQDSMRAAAAVSLLKCLSCYPTLLSEFSLTGGITGVTIISALSQLGGLLALPLIAMYNGEKGSSPRLGFYLFYPLHLMLLFYIKYVLAV